MPRRFASDAANTGKKLKDFLVNSYHENLNGYLFANRNGNTFSVGKVAEYGLWPVQKALRIERTGLHAFRHAAATKFLKKGPRDVGLSCLFALNSWSGRWESNPRPKLGKLLYCHCTTPAQHPADAGKVRGFHVAARAAQPPAFQFNWSQMESIG